MIARTAGYYGFVRAFVLALAATVSSHAAQAPLAGGGVAGWGIMATSFAEPGTRFKAIAGGKGYFSLALRSDGRVAGWGWNTLGQSTPPPGLTNVVAVSAGLVHGLALRADGIVIGWGNQGDSDPGFTNVTAIAA